GGRRVVAEVGGLQKTKPCQVAAGRVQPGRDRLLLLAGECDAGEGLRRLDHLDRDGVRVLRRDSQRVRHQRRAKADRGEALEKPPPVQGESFVVHLLAPKRRNRTVHAVRRLLVRELIVVLQRLLQPKQLGLQL